MDADSSMCLTYAYCCMYNCWWWTQTAVSVWHISVAVCTTADDGRRQKFLFDICLLLYVQLLMMDADSTICLTYACCCMYNCWWWTQTALSLWHMSVAVCTTANDERRQQYLFDICLLLYVQMLMMDADSSISLTYACCSMYNCWWWTQTAVSLWHMPVAVCTTADDGRGQQYLFDSCLLLYVQLLMMDADISICLTYACCCMYNCWWWTQTAVSVWQMPVAVCTTADDGRRQQYLFDIRLLLYVQLLMMDADSSICFTDACCCMYNCWWWTQTAVSVWHMPVGVCTTADDGRRQQYLFNRCLVLYLESLSPDDGRKERPKHVDCYSNEINIIHRCSWLFLL